MAHPVPSLDSLGISCHSFMQQTVTEHASHAVCYMPACMPAMLLTLGIQMGIQQKRQIQNLLALTANGERDRETRRTQEPGAEKTARQGRQLPRQRRPTHLPAPPPPPEARLPHQRRVSLSSQQGLPLHPGSPCPAGSGSDQGPARPLWFSSYILQQSHLSYKDCILVLLTHQPPFQVQLPLPSISRVDLCLCLCTHACAPGCGCACECVPGCVCVGGGVPVCVCVHECVPRDVFMSVCIPGCVCACDRVPGGVCVCV